MKKFIREFLILLLSLIMLLYILDWAYTYAYNNGTPRNKISYLFSQKNSSIDYVFLGSSRVDNTIDASIVEDITGKKALNLGIQGAELKDSFLMLQLLESQNIKTKFVFIQVDYSYNTDDDSPFLNSLLAPYIQNEIVYDLLKERHSHSWHLKHIPFYRYLIYDYKIGFREVFNTVIGNDPNIDLSNGFSPKYGSSGEVLTATLPENLIKKNEIILAIEKFAEENEIKIIYFTSPFCGGAKNIDFIKKLEQRIKPIFNYSSIFINREEYFFDCNHLNFSGAKEFSGIMAERINRLESKEKD